MKASSTQLRMGLFLAAALLAGSVAFAQTPPAQTPPAQAPQGQTPPAAGQDKAAPLTLEGSPRP